MAAVGAGGHARGAGDDLGLLLEQRHVVAEEDDLLAGLHQVPHVLDQHHCDEGLPAPGAQINYYVLSLGFLQQLNLNNLLETCINCSFFHLI